MAFLEGLEEQLAAGPSAGSFLPRQHAAEKGLTACEPAVACIAEHSFSVYNILLGSASERQECLLVVSKDRVADMDLAFTGSSCCQSAAARLKKAQAG